MDAVTITWFFNYSAASVLNTTSVENIFDRNIMTREIIDHLVNDTKGYENITVNKPNNTEITNMSSSNATGGNLSYTVTCNTDQGFDLYTHLFPMNSWIVYIGTILAVVVVILNSLLISVLVRKEHVTVINIFLSVLGFSDACSAMFVFMPLFIGYRLETIPIYKYGIEVMPGAASVPLHYPYCIGFHIVGIVLSDLFHDISLILTVLISLIKSFVMLFPLQSRIYLTTKAAKISCTVTILFCVALYAPFPVTKSFMWTRPYFCCVADDHIYQEVYEWIKTVIFTISYILLILSAVYICLKLTVMKGMKSQKASNTKLQERNRRSAIIVVSIVIVYMLSEIINTICVFSASFRNNYDWCYTVFWQYQELIKILGYGSNFIIYWIISRDLRAQVYRYVGVCFRLNKDETNSTVVKSSEVS